MHETGYAQAEDKQMTSQPDLSPKDSAWQPYLRLLSHDFPTQRAAAAEMVRLKTRLQLPKGTEYFFSDLHGEHQGFLRMLKSASAPSGTRLTPCFTQRSAPRTGTSWPR